MDIQELIREFKYNSVKLPDPSPAFTLVQVRDFFANVYPEIISAEIEGPDVVGNRNVYTFRRAVGTKGLGVEAVPLSQRPNVPANKNQNEGGMTPAAALRLLRGKGTLRPDVGPADSLRSDDLRLPLAIAADQLARRCTKPIQGGQVLFPPSELLQPLP